MSDYNHLVGLPYLEGKQDCYSCARTYLFEAFGIETPNLARPHNFWEDPELDLYGQYLEFGFQPVFDVPFELGDVLLMSIFTPINSHAAVVVGDNLILHHLPAQLSTTAALRPRWANRTNIRVRHPAVAEARTKPTQIQLHEVIDADILRDPEIKAAIARAVDTNLGGLRDHQSEAPNQGSKKPSLKPK